MITKLFRLLKLLLFLAVAAGLFFSFSRLKLFQIKKISCQLDYYPCPSALDTILINFYHQNLLQLKRRTIITQLQDFDPSLSEIKITKKLPQQLLIEITSQPLIAQLVPFSNLEFVGLDSSASATLAGQMQNRFFQLKKNRQLSASPYPSPLALPLVAVPDSLDLVSGADLAVKQISELVNLLHDYYVSFQLMAWLNQDLMIVATNLGPYAVFNPRENLSSQVGSLQYILGKLKIREPVPAKIDLRFDKPVLTF